MYNRYIPQPDGSFRRNRIQEQPAQHTIRNDSRPVPCPLHPPAEPPVDAPSACRQTNRERQHVAKLDCPCRNHPSGGSAAGFLKQLLPKDFDTGDLLVVLLLLLMGADNNENHNTALLTLGLYLFM